MSYPVPATRQAAMSTSLPVLIFLLACLGLDVSFGIDTLRVGNIFVLAGGAAAIVLARLSPAWPGRPRLIFADAVYLSYLALVGISSFWAPAPMTTLTELVILSTIWLATVFLSQDQITTVVRYVIHIGFIAAVLGLLMAVVTPDIAYQPTLRGQTHELRGIFHHQLRCGAYMGLAIGFLVLAKLNGDLPLVFRRNAIFYLYLGVMLVVLIMANARLYTFAMAMGLMFAIILPRPAWGRALLILAICGILYWILQDQSEIFSELDGAGFDLTLTGRTTIWLKTSLVADRAPIWGYGYASFENSMFDSMWGLYRPAHPHNSFLQAYFENGYVGYVIVVFLAATHLWITMRNAGLDRRYSYSLFIVGATIISSLTGANYAATPSSLFCYMMLAIAIDGRRGRALRGAASAQRLAIPTPMHGVAA